MNKHLPPSSFHPTSSRFNPGNTDGFPKGFPRSSGIDRGRQLEGAKPNRPFAGQISLNSAPRHGFLRGGAESHWLRPATLALKKFNLSTTVDTKKVGQTAFLVVGLLVAVVVAFSILLNPTGGVSGLSKLVTFAGIIIGILNPRAGLFFLAAQVMYSDEVKRLAVYYGVTSQLTISEVLIGPLLTLCAINTSFLYGVLRDRYTLGKLGWFLYALVPIAGLGSVFGNNLGGGMSIVLYGAATFALYITLIPVCYGLFRQLDEWVNFISCQALLAAPSAAWAIWQYYQGFNQMEWTYALSGLSVAHSAGMLADEDPRVFGFFGTAAALSCVAMYTIFCFWRAFRFRKYRLPFLLLGILFAYAAFVSRQRGVILYPFVVIAAALFFRHKRTTLLLYGGAFVIFVLGVFNADYLMAEGLEKFSNMIAMEGRWGSTLTFNTLSDRLRGWGRLARPESWSLFGTGAEGAGSGMDLESTDFNHDSINKILIEYGAIGLLCSLIFVVFILFVLHRVIFLSKDRQTRRDGAFVMGCIIPSLILSATMGDNLSASVISFQLWSVFSGVFVIGRLSGMKEFSGHLQPKPNAISPSSPSDAGQIPLPQGSR